eukprot:TRINITY_DN1250_c0_g1_i1.p1 TRINITY_DN1250_c0_g1~~TRINITY_DN1250_c0_g1_i1.p1  ORF type:complete len:153 (+),score=63.10 TRINITY_DN1250_c0_g1_i1:1-459(+)
MCIRDRYQRRVRDSTRLDKTMISNIVLLFVLFATVALAASVTELEEQLKAWRLTDAAAHGQRAGVSDNLVQAKIHKLQVELSKAELAAAGAPIVDRRNTKLPTDADMIKSDRVKVIEQTLAKLRIEQASASPDHRAVLQMRIDALLASAQKQ